MHFVFLVTSEFFNNLENSEEGDTDENNPEDKAKDGESDAEYKTDYPAEDEKACDDGNGIEDFWREYLSKKSVAYEEDAEDERQCKRIVEVANV